MGDKPSLRAVSDDELLRRLADLTRQSRRVEADLVAHIAEVDARRLYAREAAPSMFAYCTEVLHLSEPETGLRIRVARASREHPMLLGMLRDGRIHLSGIALLAPLLTPENREALLTRATHRSKRQIEELVAELKPQPDAPTEVRKLPTPRAKASASPDRALRPDTVDAPGPVHQPETVALAAPERAASGGSGQRPDAVTSGNTRLGPHPATGSSASSQTRRATVEPLAPQRYKVQFTASTEFHEKLERLQALMRSSVPDGDLGKLIEQAVTEKVERLEAQRFARTKAPRKSLAETDTRPSSRHIPAPVRRAVHERDEGRCTYVDAHGRHCTARQRLEFHHRRPFGRGGDHSPKNLALACRAHNALMADCDYGKEKMARHRSAARVSEPTAVYGSDHDVARSAGHAGPGPTIRGPGP